MRIHVHVGVHKTASTSIQNCLTANREALNKLGLGYMPLADFRRSFTQNLEALSKGGLRIDQISKHFFGEPGLEPPKGLIISDENLVGHSFGITHKGRPLASGARRLALLRKILDGHEVTLFMAVRDYGDYIASSYSEALLFLPEFLDFNIVRRRLHEDAFDWPALITSFRESLRPAHLKVWRFEDARGDMDAIVRAIAFDVTFPLGSQPGRYSLSQTAVDEVHRIAAEAGQSAATRRLRELISSPGGYSREHPFRPWSPAEKQHWSEKYDQDCARVDPGFWLIRPPAAAR